MNPIDTKIKQQLLDQLRGQLESRKQTILDAIDRVEDGLKSETKSSAGDKHETGRAMLQLEREKLGNQLNLVQIDEKTLARIELNEQTSVVKVGSLVKTSQLNYFISVGAGKLLINDDTIYAISLNSPIGQLLISRQKGDEINFRDQKIKILNVI